MNGMARMPEGVYIPTRYEEQLSSLLDQAAYEVAHAECLDCEQRAEIHEILIALRTDTAVNRKIARRLVQGQGDA